MSQLNELPEGWIETILGDVILPFETAQPKKEPEREFTYIDIGSIDNSAQEIVEPKRFLGKDAPSRARRVVKTGDVLFSTVRTYLKNIARVPQTLDGVLTSTGIAVLRPSTGINEDYLFHVVVSDDFIRKISQTMDGTLYPAVTDSDVQSAAIPLPPLKEQRRIVEKIEALTARSRKAREALEAIPALLDQFRQSVLAAAFRGDLTADWRAQNPDVEPAEALLERIRVERRQRWEAAELEKMRAKGKEPKNDKWKEKYKDVEASEENIWECPETWCQVHVKQISDVQLGRQRSPKNHYGDHMRKYLRAANVTWSGLDFSDVKEMNFDPSDFVRFKIEYGDILLNEASGSQYEVGKPAIWRNEFPDCCIQNTLIRVRPLAPLSEFLYFHFYWNAISGAFGKASKGIGIHHLGRELISEWIILLPPLSEQEEIIKKINESLEAIDALAENYQAIMSEQEQLDRSILAKAFRGDLVPQDPTDEPAAVLLERIRAERSNSKGKIQNSKKRKQT